MIESDEWVFTCSCSQLDHAVRFTRDEDGDAYVQVVLVIKREDLSKIRDWVNGASS